MSSRDQLEDCLLGHHSQLSGGLVVAVVDQYEEKVDEASLPTRFVEWLSLLDRGSLRTAPTLVIWLTTSREFQAQLADATRRNERILVAADYELAGPERSTWPDIIEETFEFHNRERPLADYEVLRADLVTASKFNETLGDAIEDVGSQLSAGTSPLQDFSQMQVIMLWPVTDGTRITRINSFTRPREGYKLDWQAWYRELSREDREQLPLEAYNRARLYFDMRLVPIAAADLQPLCRDLDKEEDPLHTSYLTRFQESHFFTFITGQWDEDQYAPLRERDSQRAREARDWYETITKRPTAIGKRIARVLRELGLNAQHEQKIMSKFSAVKADVLVDRETGEKRHVIVELKAFSPSNTMPSSIRDAVKVTFRRHAQLVGFLQRT